MHAQLTAGSPIGTARRSGLVALAIGGGALAALVWNPDITNWAYYGFLEYFLDPRAPVAGLGVGIGLGFLVGLAHITAICYLPAAVATMPVLEGVPGNRDWVRPALALALGMALVTGAFGAIVGGAGGFFGDLLASKPLVAQVMKAGMVGFGALMLLIGLGELGFIRRLLPEMHLGTTSGGAPATRSAFVTGASLAATFGIICTRPTYLAVLLSIALAGSAAYGALALGAYGVGLAVPVALGGRVLSASGRGLRLANWLRAREHGLHLAQGTLFLTLGSMVAVYFWFRYAVPSG